MLHLMTFFLVVYIFFLAVIMTYAQTYKTKNATVELIERTETSLTNADICQMLIDNSADPNGHLAITKHQTSLGKSYYSVTVVVQMKISPIGSLMTFDIPISGETKLISNDISIPTTDGVAQKVKTYWCSSTH